MQSLYLLKIGKIQTVTNLATFLGVHRVTIQKWLKKYTNGGLDKLLEIKPLTGRPSQLSNETIAELQVRLNEAENGFKSYGEIQAWLEKNSSLKIKYKTLYH
ncbi:helix-turn-helix domain-containing protein [Gloeothece verrucosa]|uniref:helix-turn-helix domain-containing protein n=1 Tax=Gloeothece verrucosa TaxID=2546359 RepID=UPI0024791B7F|nr:helix-turn-helix domain-containing protein [Gloeothece verrucosa]